ncbi:hypothetical protein MBVG596_0821 [Mycoplasmopsis bovigenitalium]|uniref:Uncharacterized protein n=1 Tax=Mycoplasmopsis bovigenitalium 51080 TaxID=1188235 RepID=N9V0X1_9BACT|nr:hypothetical protein [Mycoplasmopsis bovigenitalium]ENY69057.1 Hypothetical protein MBVG_5200 [Mycoplasmopsis bovigenitalium 51080]BAW18422.1 hypothetical protein MBVG596_0821 [Mycoplasmopsis bovigenitalium]
MFAFDLTCPSLSPLAKYKAIKELCLIEIARAKRKKQLAFNKKISQSFKEKLNNKHLYDYVSENLQRVLTCMSDANKEILEKDILKPESDKEWWEDICSKTTYYKRRTQMINEFIFYYFD